MFCGTIIATMIWKLRHHSVLAGSVHRCISIRFDHWPTSHTQSGISLAMLWSLLIAWPYLILFWRISELCIPDEYWEVCMREQYVCELVLGNLTFSKDSRRSLHRVRTLSLLHSFSLRNPAFSFPTTPIPWTLIFLILAYYSKGISKQKTERNQISSQRYGLVFLLFNVWVQLYFLSRFLLLMHQKTKFNLYESFVVKVEVLDVIFCNLTFLFNFSWLFLQLKAITVFKTHTYIYTS